MIQVVNVAPSPEPSLESLTSPLPFPLRRLFNLIVSVTPCTVPDMCFSCSGGWPWSQATHLAAPPTKEEHIFLDTSYDFYPDRRKVSEESHLAPALSVLGRTTCHLE